MAKGEMNLLFEPLDAGGKELEEQVTAMEARMSSMIVPLTEVVEAFHKIESEIFTSDGGSHPWAELAQPTIDYKEFYSYPEQTLWRTMDLMESLIGGDNGVKIITPFEAVVGTNVPYAQYHQEGTETMPERQIIPDEATMLTLLVLAVESYLFTGVAAKASDSMIADLA